MANFCTQNKPRLTPDLDKTLKLTAEPQDQGCHLKPNLIGN
jgi:hypothetical protein